MDGNELFRDWMGQHGNKKNADIKRLISILEAILSHDTVKNAMYLGAGIIVLKTILDFANERYEIKQEYELEKLLLETNKEEE
jgi:hypothetical protein